MCGVSVLVLVLICIILCPFYLYNRLDEKERCGCFAFIVFWMSYYCKCLVALLHCAKGWSAVCDFGIY